ncbi:MAG: FtsX-like permease family protein [Candidatus Omnitrophica bacterium]|nr:FtsX-like permease family protein [Candidatus Omnitrophota bacterium]
MNVAGMILKEIFHRKVNALLTLLGVVAAVGFYVAFVTMGSAAQRETTRIMRDMGYNLRIIPKDTDMENFLLVGYADETMPEDTVQRFAEQRGITFVHLLATLQQTYDWDGSRVLLTGVASEVSPADKKKPPMLFDVQPGTLYVGHEVADSKGLKKGDKVELGGQEFKVERTLTEAGSVDDIRVYADLADAQKILGKPGQINEIKALDCLCRNPNMDTIDVLRNELKEIMPEGKVVKIEAIAMARETQRIMLEDYFSIIMSVVIVVCAVWIGTLAMINTRERRYEIGVLRALGYGSAKIALLFLGKALLLGLIGAGIGFAIGSAVAMQTGPEIFKVTASSLKVEYPLLKTVIVAAPLFTALSAFIPAMVAVTDDPAVTLREQ